MIQVCIAKYENKMKADRFYSYLSTLPQSLQLQVMKHHRWEDQHASLFSKLLLMSMLEKAGIEGNLSGICYTPSGRPYLKRAPDFSLSHSGRTAVCAMSTHGRVGIDIEELKQVPFDEYRDIFSDEEWNRIQQFDGRYWFYYYWTIKEAVAKADGRGMSLLFKNIVVKENRAQTGNGSWFLKAISINESAILHIAFDIQVPEAAISLSEIAF